jgi:hypothetical protein
MAKLKLNSIQQKSKKFEKVNILIKLINIFDKIILDIIFI